MIRIVIVEDETFVRLGMKMCIEEYHVPMTVVGAFGSAEEAEIFFEHNTADILVTDIRLTGMNGLELVRSVKRRHPYMVTVIVSCHEDFTYARKAMDLGVDRYILKNEVGEKELPEFLEEEYRLKWKNIPKDILENDTEYRENEEKFGEVFLVGYIILRGKEEPYNTTKDEISFEILSEILQKILSDRKLGKSFIRHDEEIICLFNIDKKENLGVKQKDLESFFEEASRNVENYFNRNMFLILSEPFDCLKEVKINYENIVKEVWRTFYLEESSYIKMQSKESAKYPAEKLKVESYDVFREEWYIEEKERIHSYFVKCKRQNVHVKELKERLIKYCSELEIYLDNHCRNTSFASIFQEDTIPNYRNIEKYDSSECLEEYMLNSIEAIRHNVLKRVDVYDEIIRYITETFREPISIHGMAGQFHMSPAYFCQYFKKNAGITCVQYINQIRIEEAKRLLLDTNLSSEQVAEKIGIDNCNYFYRLFKKTTGMTVGEYKKVDFVNK